MNKFKFLLDTIMLLIIVLILNISATGVLIHEILGISIWLLFMTHLFVNRKWIKAISKSFLSNKLENKIKYIYVIDVLLFIDFMLITVSGVGISQKLFTFLNVSNIYLFTNLHILATYFAGALIATHLVMHFAFIKAQITSFLNKKINASNESPTVLSSILVFVSIAIVFFSTISSKNKTISSAVVATNSTTITTDDTTVNETITSDTTATPEVTLTEYLGSLVCTACHNRCPLSRPRCSRGVSQAATATEKYNQLYQ